MTGKQKKVTEQLSLSNKQINNLFLDLLVLKKNGARHINLHIKKTVQDNILIFFCRLFNLFSK